MHRIRHRAARLAAAAAAVVLTLVSSGCGIGADVDTLLRPPRSSGEQQKIQKALDEYLSGQNAGDGAGGYVLEYPKSGDYRSAFVLYDTDSDGEDEALVFYTRSKETGNSHLNLLKSTADGWQSISDIEGPSRDLEKVLFCDMNGDGVSEIITGWNVDNVRDRQMVLYSCAEGKLNEWYKDLYSEFIVADLTASGQESLLILRAGTGDAPASARLLAVQKEPNSADSVLSEKGSVMLDSYIQQFSGMKTGRLNNGLVGVYVDGTRSSGGMVTELIYWDGKSLVAPFYSSKSNATDLTYRSASIPSMDVDGDDEVEWPYTQVPSGFDKSGGDKIWQVVWRSWDGNTQTFQDKFSCIMNLADGYYVRMDDAWNGRFAVTYDKAARVLAWHALENGKMGAAFLKIRTVNTTAGTSAAAAISSETAEAADMYRLLDDRAEQGLRYEAWFSGEEPFSLNMERVLSLFARW